MAARLSPGAAKAGTVVAREHAGAVSVGLFRERSPIRDVSVAGPDFVDVALGEATFVKVTFTQMGCTDVDLRGARRNDGNGLGVHCEQVLVDVTPIVK